MKFGWLVMGLSVVLLTGCDEKDERFGFEDQRNPHFAKAQQAVQSRDWVAATKAYEAALQANPAAAQAHYELGILYGERLGDQIEAMYHFSKYLSLRPAGDNHDSAKARLDSAMITFAATLPNSPIQNASEFAKLQSEKELQGKQLEQASAKIVALEAKLKTAEEQLATIPPPSPTGPLVAAPPAPINPSTTPNPTAVKNTSPNHSTSPAVGTTKPVAVPVPAAPPKPSTYTIQSGDNPWKIAKKFFPKDINRGIEKLKQANPETMSDVRKLKPGVEINIP